MRVTYTAAQDGARQTIETPVRARFSQSTTEIAASRDNTVIESVVEQSVRARTAAAIELRDQGRHGEAQALFSQNVQEIDAQAASAPLSNRLQYLKQQYRRHRRRADAVSDRAGRATQVPAADGFESGGAGRTLLTGGNAACGAGGSGQRRRFFYDPARNDFDQYSPTCPTKAGGNGT